MKRTQVAIVGAGPSGLPLGQLRHKAGVGARRHDEFDRLVSSRAATTASAKNRVGLPFDS